MQMRSESVILRNPYCATELMYFNNGAEAKRDSRIQSCARRRQSTMPQAVQIYFLDYCEDETSRAAGS
jgi:hypothetical protein